MSFADFPPAALSLTQVHALEKHLGDCARAVQIRRRWLQRQKGVAEGALSALPYEGGVDYETVFGACAEMVVGYVPLPVGVAGPLLLNGAHFQVSSTLVCAFRPLDPPPTAATHCLCLRRRSCPQPPLPQVPLATVEGALIASTRRGCKAITEAGGACARVVRQGMTRAPVLVFPSAMRACAFQERKKCSLGMSSL